MLKTAIDRRIRVGQVEVIVRAAPHEAVKLVEAAVDRVVLRGKSQVPFPERAGDITGRLKELREEHLIQVAARTAFPGGIDAKALLVAPRDEARAGRRADVARHISLGAGDALPGQGVHVRCVYFLLTMRVVAHIGVALIVRENHNDAGQARGGTVRRRLGWSCACAQGERDERDHDDDATVKEPGRSEDRWIHVTGLAGYTAALRSPYTKNPNESPRGRQANAWKRGPDRQDSPPRPASREAFDANVLKVDAAARIVALEREGAA